MGLTVSTTQLAGAFDELPAVLLYLADRGAVVPFRDARGRGKVRQFDLFNAVEFALGVQLLHLGVEAPRIARHARVLTHLCPAAGGGPRRDALLPHLLGGPRALRCYA